MAAGMKHGAGYEGEEPKMRDLASAIEEAPAEVEPEGDDELDPEQAAIIEEGGFTPEQGKALIRLIETMM
jgi:hypothetical protein